MEAEKLKQSDSFINKISYDSCSNLSNHLISLFCSYGIELEQFLPV